jgi:membrane protease YdiL (CAAX protease family)
VSENRLTWGQAFGFRRRSAGRSILLGVLAAAVVFSMTLLLLLPASQWLMELVHLTPQPQDAIEALRKTHDLARQSAVAVSAVVLAPVFEELLFRGVFFAALKQAGLPRLAFWLSATIWAATHVNLMTFLPLAFFGVVLNLLYERTGNLLAPITAHAFFNLVNYLWVVFGPAVE